MNKFKWVHMKIKICGMRDAGNIATVGAMLPDYMGFIEYAASARFVGSGFRTPILPAGISRVGVFVNESCEEIQRRVASAGYDAIQLHGDESPDVCERLRASGLKVIKAFRIHDQFDFNETKRYAHDVDFFLFDARGEKPGGNGVRFDFRTLQGYDQRIPFFLSGGLHPENLKKDIAALTGMNLHGVDLNSGVEQSPGFKDPERVRTAIGLCRGDVKPVFGSSR